MNYTILYKADRERYGGEVICGAITRVIAICRTAVEFNFAALIEITPSEAVAPGARRSLFATDSQYMALVQY